MKFITSQAELSRQFARLIRSYSSIRWATAWAGVDSEPFAALVKAQSKITRMVVGIHFYQTHPDFIEALRSNRHVRFIQQPDGTFHPKLYLFSDDKGAWEMLIGSGNFTRAAFTTNAEASLLVRSTDPAAASLIGPAEKLLEKSWKVARRLSPQELDAYRTIWKNHQAKIRSLSGKYGNRRTGGGAAPTPIHEVPVAVMTWREFMSKVSDDRFDSLSKRLAMLAEIRQWFTQSEAFGSLTDDQRKFIAGLPNAISTKRLQGLWFGSMKGAGKFRQKIGSNDANLARALDSVPLQGDVTRSHYNAFVRHFSKSLPGVYVAPATRLLAMKRPDTFVCLDSKNRKKLCLDFKIPQSGMGYERYWEEIVERIRDSEWWLHPEPKNESERQVSSARAAFLDSLYYEEPA